MAFNTLSLIYRKRLPGYYKQLNPHYSIPIIRILCYESVLTNPCSIFIYADFQNACQINHIE